MNIKNLILASVFLAAALPAFAQDDAPVYTDADDCINNAIHEQDPAHHPVDTGSPEFKSLYDRCVAQTGHTPGTWQKDSGMMILD